MLHINPTVEPVRKEPEEIKIFVYDFDKDHVTVKEVHHIEGCFAFLETPSVSWINIDGLKKHEVTQICNYYGIHPLIIEDILSIGQRPKMDEIDGLLFCLLNMLYYDAKATRVETEQISIVLGKNFVITFQEDAQEMFSTP